MSRKNIYARNIATSLPVGERSLMLCKLLHQLIHLLMGIYTWSMLIYAKLCFNNLSLWESSQIFDAYPQWRAAHKDKKTLPTLWLFRYNMFFFHFNYFFNYIIFIELYNTIFFLHQTINYLLFIKLFSLLRIYSTNELSVQCLGIDIDPKTLNSWMTIYMCAPLEYVKAV
jgi:hypothetical protein